MVESNSKLGLFVWGASNVLVNPAIGSVLRRLDIRSCFRLFYPSASLALSLSSSPRSASLPPPARIAAASCLTYDAPYNASYMVSTHSAPHETLAWVRVRVMMDKDEANLW